MYFESVQDVSNVVTKSDLFHGWNTENGKIGDSMTLTHKNKFENWAEFCTGLGKHCVSFCQRFSTLLFRYYSIIYIFILNFLFELRKSSQFHINVLLLNLKGEWAQSKHSTKLYNMIREWVHCLARAGRGNAHMPQSNLSGNAESSTIVHVCNELRSS